MKKILLTLMTLLSFALTSSAQTQPSDIELKNMIARMIIIGFDDAVLDANSSIVRDLQAYELGGVILFDKFYNDRNRTKNIASPQQLLKLTSELKKYAKKPLFISVDQEGGRVARLKEEYGFESIPSALSVSKISKEEAQKIYQTQSLMLHNSGINMNFAPVVDLAINPENKVIVGLERSFSQDPMAVSNYAQLLINEQNKHNIISVLKHFPGHGSSFGDSHRGFVDVSQSWKSEELEPYERLIEAGEVDAIMSAHVFNKNLDEQHPATLSYKTTTELLRNSMGYNGVVISDDLQMGAITQHYSLKERVTLAINAGVDMLLFGNQLEENSLEKIIRTIFREVKCGAISLERILESNARIENLLTKASIIQKPLLFGEKRKELTLAYIKEHYGLTPKDITIVPKMIVLHWTADMSFEKSFERLYPELLVSDRTDIVNASVLNVSAHFLIDRNGSIYQLMPDNFMARHVIGLNYTSIGIENIGGENNEKEDLTEAQLQANIRVVKYLQAKYPTINHVIGHHEYMQYEKDSLWLEKDALYRTQKKDPGQKFMKDVRDALGE